jgi:hypothetical protein
MVQRVWLQVLVGVGFLWIGSSVVAQELATLKGHFVYDGEPPAPEKLVPDKDTEVCGKHTLVREQVAVGKDGGLANIAVWLNTKGIAAPADAPSPGPVVLDNKDCRFEPHIVVLRTGQPLELKNSDPVGHNTMASPQNNSTFNVLIPANGTQSIKSLTRPERMPFEVKCSIHPWMNAWVILQDGPFVAVTGADGGFEIKGLPTGKKLEFQVWQEKVRFLKNIKLGSTTTSAFGRFSLTLTPGENDLGTIKVSPAALK